MPLRRSARDAQRERQKKLGLSSSVNRALAGAELERVAALGGSGFDSISNCETSVQ